MLTIALVEMEKGTPLPSFTLHANAKPTSLINGNGL